MPEAPSYQSACRVRDPIVTASWGVPVTATARFQDTRNAISSPNSYVWSAGGLLQICIAVAAGAGARLPSTLCAALFETACAPNARFATVVPFAAKLIVPPFSARLPPKRVNPSLSESTARTV